MYGLIIQYYYVNCNLEVAVFKRFPPKLVKSNFCNTFHQLGQVRCPNETINILFEAPSNNFGENSPYLRYYG